ncbi:hypothetical protein E2C01_034325 [Portunus trituberculatus]|uniref:Uncharacterized protein n=1 Tax=Portunus trituberculatus TaxID=210409 RepID=A0A5B7F6B5_PORTR|nr:hypothetical protein [Portunus trituberculatus]
MKAHLARTAGFRHFPPYRLRHPRDPRGQGKEPAAVCVPPTGFPEILLGLTKARGAGVDGAPGGHDARGYQRAISNWYTSHPPPPPPPPPPPSAAAAAAAVPPTPPVRPSVHPSIPSLCKTSHLHSADDVKLTLI